MSVRTGQSLTVDFTTRNPSTGAAADASSTPTGTLVINGTDNGATVTVTNKATGVYKAAVTVPTLSAGDVVQVRIAATVSGVSDNEVVFEDTCDPEEAAFWTYPSRTLTSGNTIVVEEPQSGTMSPSTWVKGDAFTSSPSRPIVFTKATGSSWPSSFSGYTITLYLSLDTNNADSSSGSASAITITDTSAISSSVVHAFLTTTQSDTLYTGTHAYKYQLLATKSGEQWTLETGTLSVLPKLET